MRNEYHNDYNDHNDDQDGRFRSHLRRAVRGSNTPHKAPYAGLKDHYLTVVDVRGEKAFELPTEKEPLHFDSLKAYEMLMKGRVRLHDFEGRGVDIHFTQTTNRKAPIILNDFVVLPKNTKFREGSNEADFLHARDLNVGDYLVLSLPTTENQAFKLGTFLRHSYIRATNPAAGPTTWARDLVLADRGIKPLPRILHFPDNTI